MDFLRQWWSWVFGKLDWIRPHRWVTECVRLCKPDWKESYAFTDARVLGHFLGSIFLYVICAPPSMRWLQPIAVGYGALAVAETRQ
jgi:hypothetical protein